MEKHVHLSLTSLLPLFASICIPFLVITSSGFSYLGVALSFLLIGCTIYFNKPEKTRVDTSLFVFVVLFSFFIVLRSNPFLIFLNIIAVIFLSSLLAIDNKKPTFLNTKLAPILVFFKSLRLKPHAILPSSHKWQGTLTSYALSMEHLTSIILTVIILIVIIPLLSSSNPFFENLVRSVLNTLSLEHFFERIFGDNLIISIFRFVLFLILIFFLPRLTTFVKEGHKVRSIDASAFSFKLLLPKIVVALVIALFFFTQIQLYAASSEVLQSMGYTRSQVTREVFGQLAVVSLIIFLLIYNERSQKTINRILSFILLAEGSFLAFMAFKSDLDYTLLYGFTFKRLYGFAIVTWMLGAYATFGYMYMRHMKMAQFVQTMIIWTALILLGINVANFDYLIAHKSQARTCEGTDYEYIVYHTSADARAYRLLLDELYFSQDILPPNHTLILQTTYFVQDLQEKYAGNWDWRTFNLSQYRAYQTIKDIDVQQIRDELAEENRRFHEQYIPTQPPRNDRIDTELEVREFEPQVIEATLPPISPMVKEVELQY